MKKYRYISEEEEGRGTVKWQNKDKSLTYWFGQKYGYFYFLIFRKLNISILTAVSMEIFDEGLKPFGESTSIVGEYNFISTLAWGACALNNGTEKCYTILMYVSTNIINV